MEKKLIFMLLKSDGHTWHLASGLQTSELMWGCARLQGWRRNSDRDRTGQQHHWVSFTCVFLLSAEELHFGNHRNHMIPYQLFHLAACADEESLVDSQRCVDCSGIQLQLGSLCVGFTRELLASHADQEQQTTRSLWYLFFWHLLLLELAFPPPVEFILMRTWSPPGLTIADTTSWTDALTGSIRERGLLSGR